MGDLLSSVRIQPFLLDRLTDNEPDSQQESRDRQVMSSAQLRALVLRDLRWLFNATAPGATEDIIEDHPELQSSVVNYGMPDLAGMVLASMDANALVSGIRRAITNFEPRIDAQTLRVEMLDSERGRLGVGLSIEVSGNIWADPIPVDLHLKTEVDLGTGHFSLPGSP